MSHTKASSFLPRQQTSAEPLGSVTLDQKRCRGAAVRDHPDFHVRCSKPKPGRTAVAREARGYPVYLSLWLSHKFSFSLCYSIELFEAV